MSYLSSFPDLALIVVVDTTAYLARFSQLQTVSAVIFVLFHVSLQLMDIFYIILLVECHGDAEVCTPCSLSRPLLSGSSFAHCFQDAEANFADVCTLQDVVGPA